MIESRFLGREIVKKPTCPFCGLIIERPRELTTRRLCEMPVGSCSCGAVYACDETGHNVGNAMIEALVFGCNMDWDLAWNLLPEEDYRQEIVEQYDYVNHLIVPGGFYQSRRIAGILFFIRLHEDVQEVTLEGVRKRLEMAASVKPATSPSRARRSKEPLSKKEIEERVRAFEIEPILAAAAQDSRILRNLQRLLYSGDELFRKRAAETLGRAAAIISETDSGVVSKLLKGLFYSITDTAAFTWGAFEGIGEIISHKTEYFGGYIPQLYQYLPDETRRAQAIQTLGRIARSRPDLLRRQTFHFIPFLSDPDPQVRGYCAWLMGNLGAHEVSEDLEKLKNESTEIRIYEDGKLVVKTVGLVATEALGKT